MAELIDYVGGGGELIDYVGGELIATELGRVACENRGIVHLDQGIVHLD